MHRPILGTREKSDTDRSTPQTCWPLRRLFRDWPDDPDCAWHPIHLKEDKLAGALRRLPRGKVRTWFPAVARDCRADRVYQYHGRASNRSSDREFSSMPRGFQAREALRWVQTRSESREAKGPNRDETLQLQRLVKCFYLEGPHSNDASDA